MNWFYGKKIVLKKVGKNSGKKNSDKKGLAIGGFRKKKWKKNNDKKIVENSDKMGLGKSFNAWLIKLVPR